MNFDSKSLMLLAAAVAVWKLWPQVATVATPLVAKVRDALLGKSAPSEKIDPLTEAWGRLYEHARLTQNAKAMEMLEPLFPVLVRGVKPPEDE